MNDSKLVAQRTGVGVADKVLDLYVNPEEGLLFLDHAYVEMDEKGEPLYKLGSSLELKREDALWLAEALQQAVKEYY